MLKLTQNAVATLTEERAESGAPDTFGVRFFTSPGPAIDELRLGMEFVALPERGDAYIQERGLRAYVAPELSQLVGDATVDVERVDGRPQVVLRRQQVGPDR